MMIFLILVIGFIWGTVDYFRLPKPPKDLTYTELQAYYGGEWKNYIDTEDE